MSGTRVWIVDDSAFVGHAIAWALRRAGFEPVIARDLWDLERPELGKPDLVLLDVVLQEAFGDDLVPLLRGARGFACPILLISALPDRELAERAADAGVDGYVAKRDGLAAVVARVTELLGAPSAPESPLDVASAFALAARQSAFRILHIAAALERWNPTAMVAEAHVLAGDADLAGATALADAARAVRDAARDHGASGPSAETTRALEALAAAVGVEGPAAGKLLVVDASGFCRENLFPMLDREGYVLMEAGSLAEARQKIHAARYDLILVDEAMQRDDPSMVPELRAAAPDVGLETLGVMPLGKHLSPPRLVEEIRERLRRRA